MGGGPNNPVLIGDDDVVSLMSCLLFFLAFLDAF
jgi:hypothetical protein